MNKNEREEMFNQVFAPKKDEYVLFLYDAPHDEISDSETWMKRRIIRDRLKDLEENRIVQKQMKVKLYVYTLTDKVIKKWSQMLGYNI